MFTIMGYSQSQIDYRWKILILTALTFIALC